MYRYLLYYKTYKDESLTGDGRAEFEMTQPIIGSVDLEPAETKIKWSLRPGHRCMIVDYRLMARLIDGVWVSADA